MSHEVESMFPGNREVPWHKLGTVVEGRLNAADAIEAAGLDWTVVLSSIYTNWTDENDRPITIDVPNKYATVRETDGRVLGVVGQRYEVIQNEDLFGFLDAIVESDDAHYETAGSLRHGGTVWMLLKPNADEINIDGDRMEQYLLATTSHDGTSSVVVRPVITRVVCANTLALGLAESQSEFRARHTRSATSKIDEARTALRMTLRYRDEFEAYAKRLAAVEMSLSEQHSVVEKLVPAGETEREERIREKVRDSIFESLAGPFIQPNHKRNAWGLLQAVNDYELWTQGSDKTRSERQALKAVRGYGLTTRARNLLG